MLDTSQRGEGFLRGGANRGARRLEGKRVLFVAPAFFGYDQDIAGELHRVGAQVDRLFDRPFKSSYMMGAARVAPELASFALLPYYFRWLRLNAVGYDVILVINGQTLPKSFLEELRRRYPAATFILYIWDSIQNRPSLKKKLRYYDQIFGFDARDCDAYGFRYRPTFFSRRFESRAAVEDIGVSFIGTAHTDRALVLDAIDRAIPVDISRLWYLYLQAPWVFYLYKLGGKLPAWGKDRFQYNKLGRDETADIFHRSRVIVDIQHPRQHGLTMRIFEGLAAGKKIITTSAEIRCHDVYQEDSVLIVDRAKPSPVEPSFFREPAPPLPEAIVNRYSLTAWLDEILEFSYL